MQQIECSQLDVSYQPLIYVDVFITFDSGLILNKKKNVTLWYYLLQQKKYRNNNNEWITISVN